MDFDDGFVVVVCFLMLLKLIKFKVMVCDFGEFVRNVIVDVIIIIYVVEGFFWFFFLFYEVYVMENKKVGMEVICVEVVSVDFVIFYRILYGNVRGDFYLNEEIGWIIIVLLLDYEIVV